MECLSAQLYAELLPGLSRQPSADTPSSSDGGCVVEPATAAAAIAAQLCGGPADGAGTSAESLLAALFPTACQVKLGWDCGTELTLLAWQAPPGGSAAGACTAPLTLASRQRGRCQLVCSPPPGAAEQQLLGELAAELALQFDQLAKEQREAAYGSLSQLALQGLLAAAPPHARRPSAACSSSSAMHA